MSAERHSHPRWVPKTIGPYTLLRVLGTGGMGVVFLGARDIAPGVERQFALKVLHPHLAGSTDERRDLMREASIAARIRHPNVVQVVELVEDEGILALVLEYVEGDSLASLLREARRRGERLPLRVVTRVLVDALSGLECAHNLQDDEGRPHGLVHRDFSPHNILVRRDGVSKLTDFGVAKIAHAQDRTATGIVKGKFAYMSPEQITGEPLDRRSDVWAAGVVAWEALTGRRLFQGDGDVAKAMAILRSPAPPWVSTIVADAPPGIDQAVASALVHDRDQRTGSAAVLSEQIAAALDELADDDEVAAVLNALVGERLESLRTASRSAVVAKNATAPPTTRDDDDGTTTMVRPKQRSSLAWLAVPVAGAIVAGATLATSPPHQRGPTVARAPARLTVTASPVVAVKITANAAMRSVSVGQHELGLAAASHEVTVSIPPVDTPLEVVARDTRDRSAVGTLQRGSHHVHLTFLQGALSSSPKRSPPVPRPGTRTPPPSSSKSAPEFFDDPYGKPR